MEAFKIIKNTALFLFLAAVPSISWAAGLFPAVSWPSLFLLMACLFCVLWLKARSTSQNLKAVLSTRREEWALCEGDQIVDHSAGFPGKSLAEFKLYWDSNAIPKVTSALKTLMEKNKPFQIRVPDAVDGFHYQLTGEGKEGKSIFWLRDITNQMLAEQIHLDAIQKNEHLLSKLQSIMDSLPFLVWHRDENQKINYCNAAYSKAVGSTPSKIYADNIELIPARFAKTLARKAHNLKELQILESPATADGERKHFRVCEVPDKIGEGTLGFAYDITELNEAKANTKKIVAAHDDVLDHLSTAVAIFDSTGILQYYNQAYVRLKSFDEDFLHSKPGLDQVLEDLRSRRQLPEYADFPAYKKHLIQQLTEQTEPFEELIHLPDERTIRMFTAPHPMGGLLFMMEDVTDYLFLERHNKALLDAYQTTLNNLSEGVIVIGSDNRLKIFNPSFLTMWNFSEADIEADMHLSQIIDKMKDFFEYEGDWEPFKAQIIENATDRVAKTGRLKRKNKTVVDFGYVPLPNGDHLLSYTDATSTARSKQALVKKNESLERVDHLKSEFIANMSDQLKSPLNTIIGFTEILNSKYAGDLNKKQSDYIQGVLDSSNKLYHMVNDILDLASIEAGSLSLHHEKISIPNLLNEIIDQVSMRAKLNKQKLVLKCNAKVKDWLVDESRLKQVLINLLNNAIKFTSQKGTITLEAKSVGKELEISVTDTGVGIPANDHDRVFAKFERGNGELKKGVGLGLALVKNLVELHGGYVKIFSEVNQGTKVSLYLPKVPVAYQAAEGTPLVVEYSK